MMYKYLILYCIFLISCHQDYNLNDEKNYVLVRTDSFQNVIASKVLINKFDTSRKLVMLYSGDGILVSKGYFKGKIRDGYNIDCYMDGKLQSLEFYVNGVKQGVQEKYYPNGNIKKREKFEKGKIILEEKFDSFGVKIK